MKTLLGPRFPFDPGRLPFFYGWMIVGLSTIGVLASIPGQTMGLSVFTDSVLGATGASRLAFSNAYLVGTVLSGLLLPWGGQWIDRYGVRPVALCACLALCATLWLLSFSDVAVARFSKVLGEPLGGAWAAPAFFAVTFLFLRFSGQGLLTLASRTMMGRWFDQRRGLVAASSGAFISFGFSLAPVLLLAWINSSGWREAWREMGIVVLVVGVIAVVFFRDRPEDIGQCVDGVALPANGALSSSPLSSTTGLKAEGRAEISELEIEGWDVGGGAVTSEAPLDFNATRSEAMRTLDFWLLTGAIAIQALVGTALTFHIVDLGALNGLDASKAVGLFIPISFVSVLLGFFVGYLVDRVPIVRLVQLMLIGEAVAFFAATNLQDPVWRWVMVAGWGIAGGCYGPLTVAALPRLFGRRYLGSISGMMTMFLVIASALGPAFFALSKDVTGAYSQALLLSSALPIVGLLVSPLVKR